MKKVFVGKIVNTHGIKGEFRIKSDFDRKDLLFIVGQEIYIGSSLYKIASYRRHKEYDMITLEGYNNINDVLEFKGMNVFVDRDSLQLKSDEVIYNDLVGMEVICSSDVLGIADDYINDKNPLLEVRGVDNKVFYIPLLGNFILDVNSTDKRISVSEETKGLML